MNRRLVLLSDVPRQVRRLYNVPMRREPRGSSLWHHRYRVGELTMPSSECPSDFYLYSPRPHLQYGGPHHNRSSGTTPCFTVAPGRTAYAETLQLSNPVVELKYVNRRENIRVATSTKAVSGENPVVNQVRGGVSTLCKCTESRAPQRMTVQATTMSTDCRFSGVFFFPVWCSSSTCLSPRR